MNADALSGLAARFPADRISWRVGSTTKGENVRGMALAYVDARDIMDRLDAVVGPANWQDRYRREHETTICSLSIRINGEWVTKEDGSGDTDVEAEKGALSKALVRAAVKWQIGRYLYDLASPWVECEQRGRSVTIKPSEMSKLRAILDRDARATEPAQIEPDEREVADELSSSQLMAGGMIDALMKRSGSAAVETFLGKDAIKRDLALLDMHDHTRVMRVAAERRALAPAQQTGRAAA